jgi:hypothetical protein
VKLLPSTAAMIVVPLILVSAAIIAPADANTFHNRNVGSAPNPTARDIQLSVPISGLSSYIRDKE